MSNKISVWALMRADNDLRAVFLNVEDLIKHVNEMWDEDFKTLEEVEEDLSQDGEMYISKGPLYYDKSIIREEKLNTVLD